MSSKQIMLQRSKWVMGLGVSTLLLFLLELWLISNRTVLGVVGAITLLAGLLAVGVLDMYTWSKMPCTNRYDLLTSVETRLSRAKSALLEGNMFVARTNLMDAVSMIHAVHAEIEAQETEL